MAESYYIIPGEPGLYASPIGKHGIDPRRVEIQWAWGRLFAQDGREFARIFDGRYVVIPDVVGGTAERRRAYVEGFEAQARYMVEQEAKDAALDAMVEEGLMRETTPEQDS